MSMKKILSVLVACGIIVSVLAACGSKPVTTDEKTNTSMSESGADNSSESETSNDNTKPTEPSFLPPAEHSNFIAPKAQKGQKYEIKKLETKDENGYSREVGCFDENHVVLNERAVYDFSGNLLFDEQKVIDACSGDVSSALIRTDFDRRVNVFGDYAMIGFGDYIYDYVSNSIVKFGDENIKPYKIFDGFFEIQKKNKETSETEYSIINFEKNTVIPFESGYFVVFIDDERILAQKDKKYFVLDLSGNVVAELKNDYYEILPFHAFELNHKDEFMFLNLKKQTTDYLVGKIGHKENDDNFFTSYSYYLIDKNGKEIFLSDENSAFTSDCRMVSQYNGKTYMVEYLDDYYDNENGGKTQKRQLIDENKNVIIPPCVSLSGFINGYCRVGEYNEQSNLVTYSLVDLNGNVIESFSYKATLPLSDLTVSDFSISLVDEQGFYVIKRFENGSAVYTIKDIAGNVVYISDKDIDSIKPLGNGLFMINGDLSSSLKSALAEASGEDKFKKYIIRITRT